MGLPTGTFLLHPLFGFTTCSCNFYFISDDDVYLTNKNEKAKKIKKNKLSYQYPKSK